MSNEIPIIDETAIVWADSTFSPTISTLTKTHQLNLISLVAGAARQGVKADLNKGKAFRARVWKIFTSVEYATAIAAGEIGAVYFSQSPSPVAGNANPGGLSGTDAVYTGTGADTLANSLKPLNGPHPVNLTIDVAPTVQFQQVGVLVEPLRYISPVYHNLPVADALHSDGIEMFIALMPVVPQGQP